MRPTQNIVFPFLLGTIGALFFIPFIGGVHLFDWDEANFAEISREMIVLNDYLRIHVNFSPFWEKPPMFFWLQVSSMHIFGINEFAARLPNAICGILTLIVVYQIGFKLYNRTFGIIWAGLYLGSLLPHFYFKFGIIDPWFNLFIFLGLYFFIQSYWSKRQFQNIRLKRSSIYYLMLAGAFTGLAMLTKGQVALVILVICLLAYWLIRRLRWYVPVHYFILFIIVSLGVTAIWYGIETAVNGPLFVTEFIRYQIRLLSTPDAGHAGFPGYHTVILLVGCFPASIFAIKSFFKPYQNELYQKDFTLWMQILFWTVLDAFTLLFANCTVKLSQATTWLLGPACTTACTNWIHCVTLY